jgi:hypothetical protein
MAVQTSGCAGLFYWLKFNFFLSFRVYNVIATGHCLFLRTTIAGCRFIYHEL